MHNIFYKKQNSRTLYNSLHNSTALLHKTTLRKLLQHFSTSLQNLYDFTKLVQHFSTLWTLLHNSTQLYKIAQRLATRLYTTCLQNSFNVSSQLYTTLHNLTKLHTTFFFRIIDIAKLHDILQIYNTPQHCYKLYKALHNLSNMFKTLQHFTIHTSIQVYTILSTWQNSITPYRTAQHFTTLCITAQHIYKI